MNLWRWLRRRRKPKVMVEFDFPWVSSVHTVVVSNDDGRIIARDFFEDGTVIEYETMRTEGQRLLDKALGGDE